MDQLQNGHFLIVFSNYARVGTIFFSNLQMFIFPKLVKMEIDQGTSNCHSNSSKYMQIYHICMQI
jgi:hypothetical protein